MKIARILLLSTTALLASCASPGPDNAANAAVTADVGTINLSVPDVHWGMYGIYLRDLIARVQQQWNHSLPPTAHLPSGTAVTITVWLGGDGKIIRFGPVDSHSTTAGADACLAALKNAQPFAAWPDAMMTTLGAQQELTFTFIYR